MKRKKLIFTVIFIITTIIAISADKRKPIYIIGHQTNSLGAVVPYLENGANVLECDVQFNKDGTVKEIFHGCDIPHDYDTDCDQRGHLDEFLSYLHNITDPKTKKSYYNELIMVFFDLKLTSSMKLENAGKEIAKHVLDYLWCKEEREQKIKVLLYIDEVDKKNALLGFLQEFKDRGRKSRLKDVGFDLGMGNIIETKQLSEELRFENIWLGDGTTNCFSASHPPNRLKAEIDIRNSNGFVKKVYDWTVDDKSKHRLSLDLGVDGFITNVPSNLIEVLNEPEFKTKFRLASIHDLPF